MTDRFEAQAARRALGRGLGVLAAHPMATGAAVLAGAMGALAVAAAQAGAGRLVRVAGPAHGVLAAAALWLIGGAVAALAYGTSLGAVLDGGRLRGAVRRGTAVISLVAVERLIELCLALGSVMVFGRWASAHPDAGMVARVAAAAAAIAPALPLWMLTVPAFAVAVSRAAAGDPSFEALPFGLALALRRFGAVVRTGLLALLATSPLWVPPVALGGRIAATPVRGIALAATALAGALGMLAALWSYAALGALAVELSPFLFPSLPLSGDGEPVEG